MTGQDLISDCLQASGASPGVAERAALAAMEPDILGLLIAHHAAGLVRIGRPVDLAQAEAIDAVAVFLEDVARLSPKDIKIGKALRQSRVYRLRAIRGMAYAVIMERTGICVRQLKRDYEAQLELYRTT